MSKKCQNSQKMAKKTTISIFIDQQDVLSGLKVDIHVRLEPPKLLETFRITYPVDALVMSLDALELLNQLENLRESSKREKRVRVEWSKQQHHQQQSMQQSVSQLLSVSRYSQQDQPSVSNL